MNLYNLPIHKESPKIINCIIEIPKGTNAKYEYDNELGVFFYDRSLTSAFMYPCSYGFIPNTLGGDGDALDVLVYNHSPIDRGTLVECTPIGVLDMEDDGMKDYKILATPTCHVNKYTCLDDVNSLFLKICSNFFQHYKDLNGKKVEVFDWHEKEMAYQIINESTKNDRP